MSIAGVQHDRRPAIKLVVGDGSNLPTVRFSGVADAQLRSDAREYVAVCGCVRAPVAVVVAVRPHSLQKQVADVRPFRPESADGTCLPTAGEARYRCCWTSWLRAVHFGCSGVLLSAQQAPPEIRQCSAWRFADDEPLPSDIATGHRSPGSPESCLGTEEGEALLGRNVKFLLTGTFRLSWAYALAAWRCLMSSHGSSNEPAVNLCLLDPA